MEAVTGMILAGGKSRRMGGGDKSLSLLGGRPLIAHVIDRIRPQVSDLIVNAAADGERFREFGLEVVCDVIEGQAGPLAGVLTGMEWLSENRPGCEWLLTVPVDTPFLPPDLVRRLAEAVSNDKADMACALSGGRTHPVIGLWPARLSGVLRHALTVEDVRKIDAWTARYRIAHVEFATVPQDPFFNVNRPEDLAEAEAASSFPSPPVSFLKDDANKKLPS